MKEQKTLKNRLKENKAITLIALVITVIVLLILAGVSISAITGNESAMGKANEAKAENSKANELEEIKLAVVEAVAQGNDGKVSLTNLKTALLKIPGTVNEAEVNALTGNGPWKVKGKNTGVEYTIKENGQVGEWWTYDHATQTVSKGELVLKIGDYVETEPYEVDGKTFNGKWRVLGEENGQLLLVSANYVDFTGSTGDGRPPLMQLQGSDGIDECVEKLNTLGAKFADGKKTEKGRSITVKDINTITGYNPMETRLSQNDLTQIGLYGNGSIYQYGNNVTYTMEGGKVWYQGDKSQTTKTQSTKTEFWLPGTNSNITAPYTIESTYYLYFPETLGSFPSYIVSSGQTMEGISTSSPAYDMLFKPQGPQYWLASPCVYASTGNVNWNLFIVSAGGMVKGYDLWGSDSGSLSANGGLRPAVCLKSNITPELKSTDSSTGISTYEI